MTATAEPTASLLVQPPVQIEVPLLGSDFAALQTAGGAAQTPHSPINHANLLMFVALTEWQCSLVQAAAGQAPFKPIALPAPYPMPADRPHAAIDLELSAVQHVVLVAVAQSTDPARLGEVLGGLIRDGVSNMKRAMTEIGRAV